MEKVFKLSIFLIFLSLCGACSKDEAETSGGISGLVTNRENGEPLSGVNITLNPGGKAATTGSDGRYEFAGLEPAIYTVQAKCSGYKTNTKSVTVVAGEIMVGDLQMEVGADNFALSTRELKFSPSNTSNVLSVTNTSVTMSISWSIIECPSWLSVSKRSNENLQKGKSDDIVVTLGNNPQSEGYIVIQSAGSTASIYVTYTANGSGEGGDEGGDEGGGSEVSGTVTTCDSRIHVSMTGFRMSGTTAILEYLLRNDGEDIANFDLEKYGCLVYDDLGTGYDTDYSSKVYYELGSKKAFDGWSRLRQPFPSGTSLKGTIKIMNVPSSAKEFTNITITVATYASSWKLDGEKIVFKNVKIK